jgi:hypothetical protein
LVLTNGVANGLRYEDDRHRSPLYRFGPPFPDGSPIAEPISDAAASRNLISLSEAIQCAVEDWFAAQNWEPR